MSDLLVGAPSPDVRRAFGVHERPSPLLGGEGRSWRCGGLVLKPGAGAVQGYLAEVYDAADLDGVRVGRPVRTSDGEWSHVGWIATEFVEGAEPDWSQPTTTAMAVIEAGRAFHRATAYARRPSFVDRRSDPWALADRAAWGERLVHLQPELTQVASRLAAALVPLGPSRLVHGDLTGNVVFAPGLPAGVIDVSPYWRPTTYAEGVVVADALCWRGAGPELLELAGVSVGAVARGLLFRLCTTAEHAIETGNDRWVEPAAARYRAAATAIGL